MGGAPKTSYKNGSDEQLQVTLRYKDENVGDKIEYNPLLDNTFSNVYVDSADLNTFLGRPVLIQTYLWGVNTSLNTTFNPWDDYFNSTTIKNKLENYTFIQANLRIKLVVNASPFFYGCGLIAYEPLPLFTPAPINDNLANEIKSVGYSQRPHFWFYPSCNQGGEMLLPFIQKQDWLDITTRTDVQNMGKIKLVSPANLLNANGVTGNVSVQIYAWATDVKLCGPTMSAAMQSEEYSDGEDEYDTEGVISVPASAVAEAASCLEEVPVIGPFATATRIVASGIATVAAWFGWTNSPVIDNVMPFKDLPFHSMASAEISQPVEKLTLDPKNEISVDPRTVGLTSADELIISSLVTKESFLGISSWVSTDATDTLLFSARLLPEYYREETLTSVVNTQMSPLKWLSSMFSYWRGDIIFRFRFICSKYHKGRVIFSWDPDSNISTTAGSATTNFSRIVDVSEESDVEIRCNYMQASTFLRIDGDRTKTNLVFKTGTLSDHNPSLDNGILTCRVFTEQTSPIASADIQVYVSVRGAENMEFAAPKDISFDYGAYTTQSEELTYGAPPEIALTGSGTGAEDPHKNLVYMGETMKSLRQLLRRTVLSRVSNFATDTTNRFLIFDCKRSRFPLYYGYDPSGVDSATGQISAVPEPFNFVSQHPLNWIRMCFVGSRGSIRWQYNLQCKHPVSNMRVVRKIETRTTAKYDGTLFIASGSNADAVTRDMTCSVLLAGAGGQSVTNQLTQTGLAVEVPMYSRYRMINNSPGNQTIGIAQDDTDTDTQVFTATINPLSDTTGFDPKNCLLYSYCSAGTDYTTLYFLNIPTLYYYGSVPVAT